MKLKKRILNDLKKARKDKFERMEETLTILLGVIRDDNLTTDDEILDSLENAIIALGNEIVSSMENGKPERMEPKMFDQNIYNEYVGEFKYGKYRPIYYERQIKELDNTNLTQDENAITFKVELN